MRINSFIISSLLATGLCPAAALAYTNPTTVPVMIQIAAYSTSTVVGYHDLPSVIDVGQFYKEYTSPGPVLHFTTNAPETTDDGLAAPNTFDVQLWWVDPTPEDASSTDDDATTDTSTDQRFRYQNLDLYEPTGVSDTIYNCTSHGDNPPPLQGTIFNLSVLDSDFKPQYLEMGVCSVDTDKPNTLATANTYWNSPAMTYTDFTEGTVMIYTPTTPYAIIFNIQDNSELSSSTYSYFATIGKIGENDMTAIKMMAGVTDVYDLTQVFYMNSDFPRIPLWNTYTVDDYSSYKSPDAEDYITIKSIEIGDVSGVEQLNGLKFLEDLPYDSDKDYEDTDDVNSVDTDSDGVFDDAEIDPNASIKAIYDVSLTSDGKLSISIKSGVTMSSSYSGTYYYYFRTYVDDGINNGLTGTDYLRCWLTIYIYRPLAIYLGATYSTSVDYDTDATATNTYYWYSSSIYGWYMEQNFPTNRLGYSYEHGWIYMYGDSITSTDGVYWYNCPSTYDDGDDSTAYVDDEAGWIWTSSQYYPYFYSYKDKGWLAYVPYDADTDKTLNARLFWSYRQEKYIHPSGIGAGL